MILATIWLMGCIFPVFNLISDIGWYVCVSSLGTFTGSFKVYVTALLLYFNFGANSECFQQSRIGKGKLFWEKIIDVHITSE